MNPFNIREMRKYIKITKLSSHVDKHIKKRCGYCDWDLGYGHEVQIVDFISHLLGEHQDKLTPEDEKKFSELVGMFD